LCKPLDMKNYFPVFLLLILFKFNNCIAQEVIQVQKFKKVMISPYIQATFIKTGQESVTVLSSKLPAEKLHIESRDNELQIYLEGAKVIPKEEMWKKSRPEKNKPLYKGTQVKVAISYNLLEQLSIAGEETIHLNGQLNQEKFRLSLYGDNKVYIDTVQLHHMNTHIFGTGKLEIKAGNIDEQKLITYGESTVNTLPITNLVTRTSTYGSASIKVNVSKLLTVNNFGEATVGYKDNPRIKKSLNMGARKIYRID
jgi:hypothetical protein